MAVLELEEKTITTAEPNADASVATLFVPPPLEEVSGHAMALPEERFPSYYYGDRWEEEVVSSVLVAILLQSGRRQAARRTAVYTINT